MRKNLLQYPADAWAIALIAMTFAGQLSLYLFVDDVGVLGGLIAHRPVPALIAFVMPMSMMLYMVKWAAYAHHSGLASEDDHAGSRTHTGRFYNWATWNAGYHAAHHFKQALHWTLLSEYHERELAAKIPAALQGNGWGEDLKQRRAHSGHLAPT